GPLPFPVRNLLQTASCGFIVTDALKPTTLSSTSTSSSNWSPAIAPRRSSAKLVSQFFLQFQLQLGRNVRLLWIFELN
ncbi:adagio protein 1, partial [Quercus suber]